MRRVRGAASRRRLSATLLVGGLAAGMAPALAQPATSGSGAQDSALAAAAAPRLLANPGFEAGTTPVSWSFSSQSGAVIIVTNTVHSGAAAARVEDPSTTDGVSLRSAPLAVLPGEELTARAWMSRLSGTGGSLYLEFWKADGSRSAATSTAAGTATGWQQVSVSAAAPDDAVTATVLIYSTQANAGTTLWDDLTLEALPPPQRRVPNAGFEELRDLDTPTEWTVYAPGGSAALLKGAATAYTGRGAVRTVDTSTMNEVSVLSRRIPVAAGESLTASVWANPAQGASGTLYLEFRDSAGNRLGTPPTVEVGGGTGWRRLAVTGVAPSGTTSLTLRLYSSQTATGTITWDDVALRSSVDASYDPALAAAAPVLFVGDQRVEAYTGVSRVMHPGTKAGTDGSVFTGTGAGTWDANPRLSGTVLPGGPGYRMWYTTSTGTGYAESTDGTSWSRGGRTRTVTPTGTGGVVENPAWTSGGTQPRYFMLRPGAATDPNRHYYYMNQSSDGVTWSPVSGATPIPGWDVGNVTYDPVTRRFVAMTKQVPVDYAPPAVAPGPRTVWVSTSTDFKSWTAPRPSFAADLRDDELIPAGTGKLGMVPWTEVYGMPALRYGDQYLGLPWLFDIAYSPNRDGGDPGPDKGRSHIGLAASRDLVTWSRPNRDSLLTPGPVGSWDWGFQMTGTTMDTVRLADGRWQTRLWYSSFAGEHVCSSADAQAGMCTVPTGAARIGRVTWPTDRFLSFRAAPGGGSVTTRPVTPAGGGALTVNYDPGTGGGALRVEVLDASGQPIPGYTVADADPVTVDALAPGTRVTWGPRTTLPTGLGPIRLRFHLTGGDLYAFTVISSTP